VLSPWRWVGADEARKAGHGLRERVAPEEHARHAVAAERPGVVEFVEAGNQGRLPELVGLRVARMVASPFGFLRGSAGLMGVDLAGGPITGVNAQLCGDAHAANFGLYGTADGRIVMDINDFDDTVPGPWEWDLKRLAASLVVAGRVGGVSEKACLRAARDAARAYRRGLAHLAAEPFLQSWTALGDESVIGRAQADALTDDFAAAAKKAVGNTSARVAERVTHRSDEHGWRFVPDPPLLSAVDDQTRDEVLAGLARYPGTLRESRRELIARYDPLDVAFRVVGTGSVGLRSYVVLLHGNGDEALILQVKQAQPPSLGGVLGLEPAAHDGQRIVDGARLVQADSDILLGWTTIGGRSYIVRQFRNRKADIDAAALGGDHLDDYGRLAGTLLARAHTRSTDPRVLDGYCSWEPGDPHGKAFDKAIGRFAVAYADQTERDHAELVAAVRTGRLPSG
jgi:uncharacterized protein (DUF2252 family)